MLGFKLVNNTKNPACKWTDSSNWFPINTQDNKFLSFGVLTGIKSTFTNNKGKSKTNFHNNDITVIDLDLYKWENSVHPFLNEFPEFLKLTYSVKTGNGGYHLYFKYNEALPSTNNKELYIDIKNNGAYVVGCNSQVSNKKYRCFNNAEIKPIPDKLLRWLQTNLYNTKSPNPVATKIQENRPIDSLYNYKFTNEQLDRICNKLDSKYFNDFDYWLKFTTFCKIINKKSLWVKYSKIRSNKEYNEDDNIKIWDRTKFISGVVEHIVNNSTKIPSYRYKYKSVPDLVTRKVDVSINRQHLGKTFISEIVNKYSGHNTFVIKSDIGTGKTTAFKAYLNQLNNPLFLSIVSRRTLGRKHYDDLSENHDCSYYKFESFKDDFSFIVQLDSIKNISDDAKFDDRIVFLDEINSILEYCLSSDTLVKHRAGVFAKLIKIITTCKLIFAVDADITDIVFMFLEYCDRKIIYIENTHVHYENIISEEIKDIEEFKKIIKSKKKFAICSDSKYYIDALHEELGDNNIIKFTSTSNDADDDSINLDDYDKIMYSPKIIYGLDSLKNRDVFCIYSGKTIGVQNMIQQIGRSRNINKLYYNFPKKWFEDCPYISPEHCAEENKKRAKYLNYEDKEHENIFNEMYNVSLYKEACFNSNKYFHFKRLLKERGFKDSKIQGKSIINKTIENKTRDILKKKKLKELSNYIEALKTGEDTGKYRQFNDLRLILGLTKDNISKYEDLFIDPYKLKKHFNVARFLFNAKTPKNIDNYITKNFDDFKVPITKEKTTQLKFLVQFLKDTKAKDYNPTQLIQGKKGQKVSDDFQRLFLTHGKTRRENGNLKTDNFNDLTVMLGKIYSEALDDSIFAKKRVRKRVNGVRTNDRYTFKLSKKVYQFHTELYHIRNPVEESVFAKNITF